MNIHSHGDILRRREEIVRIVRGSSVSSQDELLALLRKRGFAVTQPTLSRDRRELGVAKTPSGYVAAGDIASISPVTSFAPRELRQARLDTLPRDSGLFAGGALKLRVLTTPA